MGTPKVSSKNLILFIWKFLKLQPWKFFFIFFLSLTWTLDATVWPYLIRRFIDVFTKYETDRAASWHALKWLMFLGGSVWIIVESSFRIRDFLRASAFPKLEADIRLSMFNYIQHHSPKYFNEHFAGSLANKISDMTTQVSLILNYLMIFVPAISTSIVSIILFYEVNPLFAFILASWVVVHLIVCFSFASKCTEYSNIHGEVRSSLAGKIVDSLTNNFTVNLFSRFQYEISRITASQKEEQHYNYIAKRYVAWMFTLLSALFFLGIFSINGYSIFLWMHGRITSGEIIQIFNNTFNVVFVMWFASEMIPQFYQSLGIASQALTVMQDRQDALDIPNAAELFVQHGEIIFDNVSFQYEDKKLFANKNVHIRGGEKVGLVGYSGAGKSTFVNLILRFFAVKSGRILIDGQDIAGVTLDSLHRQVSLIPQDPLLFHRTLTENIQYGRLEATKEEIEEVAKLSHCDVFIKKCPHGFDSLVGERGTKLSGGERQRIAIARAMLAKAPILILDEATSSLDSITEKYIQESLERLMQNRTTIVIAHRLSTLAKMDRILVFDQGEVVEEGSHRELISKGGHYSHLWQMQAGGFLPETA